MSAHTPGKWEITYSMGSAEDGVGCVVDEHGCRVCEVMNIDHAKLISAAPDLLDALKGMLASQMCQCSLCSATRVKAEAAIAKAEGR